MNTKTLEQSFLTHFNAKPAFIVRAPGRVNLIGEHTDYNDGFVLPMAIDRAVWIALSPRMDSQVHIHSLDMETALPNDPQAVSTFDLNSLTKGKGWAEYIKGVADQLQKAGYQLHGFDAIITGDVPRGAGLSSSAAVELAAARAFAVTAGFEWNAAQMAALAQKAENEWVGVNCGIMDQMASAASQAGHALFLDCRTLEYQLPPLPKGIAVVILDTSTRRGLVDSAYNERRNQCEEAARWFGVKALRDVSVAEFNEKTKDASELNVNVLKRARHIVTENERVLEAVEAMKLGNIQRLGELFNASHSSLRDDFEVTNEALNQIVACAQEQPHCFGARMTGAGFGGCAVALVREENAAAFTQAVSAAYKQRSGLEASIYVCKASDGAGVIQG
ncbi:MAG TPA: galactokinase [Anaerolineales bacterium]|nr:galactokinase [Anaerolineales bacterium]HMV94839.1 galactokinase [Anaerolineales bacterium]HMX17859.1 galactokinase [Anaerolineales bacterium]HMX72821.1 galactokinase [Anaerolineales bacterium]HMZ43886.1 galactokinase [Anaerolineales bacterium]